MCALKGRISLHLSLSRKKWTNVFMINVTLFMKGELQQRDKMLQTHPDKTITGEYFLILLRTQH